MFDKNNPPKNFYVYLYVREDQTPYYVGKGNHIRAWVKHQRKNKTELRPSNISRIRIIAHNLTEYEAFLLEKKLVDSFGFKHQDGILVNLKGGGSGGASLSNVLRENLKLSHNHEDTVERHKSASISQWSDPLSREKLMIGILSDKSILARKVTATKSWEDDDIRNKRINSMLKTTSTPEYKTMRATKTGLKANNADRTVYNFVHESGISEKCTRIELGSKYQIDSGKIGDVVNGRKNSYKGWKLDVRLN